jgi:hypothetical protein
MMDEYYKQIGLLTGDYVELNKQFIQAVKDDRPAEELTAIKEKIKVILDEIERLETLRSSASTDKDSLPM